MMLSLYAKKVNHNLGFDVIVYDDPAMVQPKCHYQWHSTLKPDYRNKYITLNCYRYKVEWIK